MVQKIQALQKRLIAKTEEVVEKDLLIQEKDKLYGTVALNAFANAEWSAGICRFYLTSRTLASASRTVELKNILARQPGPEVAEQLSIYQQGLRDKTKSMKAMASELNMYQAQVSLRWTQLALSALWSTPNAHLLLSAFHRCQKVSTRWRSSRVSCRRSSVSITSSGGVRP